MSENEDATPAGFNEKLQKFVQDVNYRKPRSDEETTEIYKLRYTAYRRAGVLNPNTPEHFKDAYDDAKNATTLGLYLEGHLAATIRIHAASADYPVVPSLQAFGDRLQPLLDAGNVIVDPTRHVVDADHAKRFPKLPYATIRVPWMACEHYAADYVLATIPLHHQAFYRRIFGQSLVSEPRQYPGISVPIILLTLNYQEARQRVYERYPYLVSTASERISIFGGSLNSAENRASIGELRIASDHT